MLEEVDQRGKHDPRTAQIEIEPASFQPVEPRYDPIVGSEDERLLSEVDRFTVGPSARRVATIARCP